MAELECDRDTTKPRGGQRAIVIYLASRACKTVGRSVEDIIPFVSRNLDSIHVVVY